MEKSGVSLNVSCMFQQMVMLYINSSVGSYDEDYVLTRIRDDYRIVIQVDNSSIVRPYLIALIDELKKRNNKQHINAFIDMLYKKNLTENNKFIYNFLTHAN